RDWSSDVCSSDLSLTDTAIGRSIVSQMKSWSETTGRDVYAAYTLQRVPQPSALNGMSLTYSLESARAVICSVCGHTKRCPSNGRLHPGANRPTVLRFPLLFIQFGFTLS